MVRGGFFVLLDPPAKIQLKQVLLTLGTNSSNCYSLSLALFARDRIHRSLTMNQLITYNEAAGVLRTPAFPKLARPDFTSIRALRKHFHSALAKLECPQSSVYGWTGVAMDPVMYALIEPNPFVIPVDPGATPTYNQGFQTQQQMKTTEQLWDNDRNYFLSYGNIHRASFRLLDDLIRAEYKVSNISGLTGWNSTMSIQEILAQLETTFGKPSANISFQNNTVFTSPFSATDTPESLFRRIEDCQEVAVLGGAPYSVPQIVGNTMYLFLQSGIFPNREFEVWDAYPAASKTWPTLKTYIQQAFQRKLVANSFRNTTGQMGYAPNNNAFNVFSTDDKSSVDTAATKDGPPPVTIGTTGSTLGSTYQASTVPTELAAAIQTIAANQQALYQHVAPLSQQMAALALRPNTNTAAIPGFVAANPAFGRVPTMPTYVGYHGGGNAGGYGGGFQQGRSSGNFQQGRSGGRGRGRSYGGARGRRQNRGRTAFADYVPHGQGYGGYTTAAPANPPNPYKVHNNWNVCYSCGFDVEDGHNSQTCHFDWRKPNHDVTFTRANAQQKLTAGCDACTKGIHKTMLPTQA